MVLCGAISISKVKPDLVICRRFNRLGFIDSEDDYVQAIHHGRKFAEATRKTIR